MPNNHGLRRRTEDNDKLARVSAWASHYKPILVIIGWLAAGAGFAILTPKQTVNELQAQINTLKNDQAEIKENLRILIRRTCIDSTVTQRDRTMLGLTQNKCAE